MKNWEEEFDEKFKAWFLLASQGKNYKIYDDCKTFIKKLLEEERNIDLLPHTLNKIRNHIQSQCADELEEICNKVVKDGLLISNFILQINEVIKKWRT